MADSSPFSNAGLGMFGAEKSFMSSAMNTHFQSPIMGLLLGKALGGLSDNETVQDLSKQLIAMGVKPSVPPAPAMPQAVAPPSSAAPISTVPVTIPAPAASAVTTAPVSSSQAAGTALPAAPSLVDFLPKQFMPR